MSVPASFDPNRAQNLPEIEKQMAVKCVEHAQTYWNLLEKLPPQKLRLTRYDDEIYHDLCESFPELAREPDQGSGATTGAAGGGTAAAAAAAAAAGTATGTGAAPGGAPTTEGRKLRGVAKIDEEEMKSAEGKKRWRDFIAKYEGKIADFNFGTLIRTDASDEYTQFNTTFVTRIQFYCYEIARNRRGHNDWVYKKAQEEAAAEKAKETK